MTLSPLEKALATSVIKGTDALTAGRSLRDDIWELISSSSLRSICENPAPIGGLPAGSVSMTVQWVLASDKSDTTGLEVGADAGAPSDRSTTLFSYDGGSFFTAVLDTIAGAGEVVKFVLRKKGQTYQKGLLDAAGAFYDVRLSQTKARQRGTFGSRSGLNRMTIRKPHD